MNDSRGNDVWVQVVAIDPQRQIRWGAAAAQHLQERIGDIKDAIVAGSSSVAESIRSLKAPDDWEIGEVTATFGIALTAEAGALLTKASGEATFEVAVTFKRKDASGGEPATS